MRIPVAFLVLVVSGCASRETIPSSYAPSPSGVLKAVTSAKASAAELRREVSTPAGVRELQKLDSQLDNSVRELATYSQKVDDLSTALTKAEDSATYWHGKEEKALHELWVLRLILLAEVGCLVGWLAFKGGMAAFLK